MVEKFGQGSFHAATALNCLDHSYDPLRAIDQVLQILKPHGVFWMSHRRNEAVSEDYGGLHQWNFERGDPEPFIIWNKESRVDVAAHFAGRCTITSEVNDEWITTTLLKTE